MAHNSEPPWLRPTRALVLSTDTDKSTSISPRTAEAKASPASSSPSSDMSSPLARVPQLVLPTASSSSAPSSPASEAGYAGWRPQSQQAAQAPPLSPLDLAMYPGAPVGADPAAARKAVAGLKPLRILSSRRPGGPASAGPSRPPGVNSASSLSEASRAGFMGLISAAKRVSGIAAQGPSSYSTPRTSTQSLPVSRLPVPVSPPPRPRTPPLVPQLRLAPDLANQIEPALKAYLESLLSQAASKSASPTSSSLPRRDSSSRVSNPGPIGLTEGDEDFMLEIRDLDAGRVISIRNLDAEVVNRESQSTSQRLPTISEFMVVRDLDAQPHTPAPAPRPPTPPLSLSPAQLLSPIHLAPDPHKPRQSRPVTLFTEAAYLNRDLEASLFELERALGYKPQSHSRSSSDSTFSPGFRSRHDNISRTQVPMRTPRTARTTSSHASSMFSSRTIPTPLTTPPASPPPLPRLFTNQPIEPPCMACSRPMQNMTSTRCGHVFCRTCVQGRNACPVCKAPVQDDDLRAIHLFV